jgi:hypothetical protein
METRQEVQMAKKKSKKKDKKKGKKKKKKKKEIKLTVLSISQPSGWEIFFIESKLIEHIRCSCIYKRS